MKKRKISVTAYSATNSFEKKMEDIIGNMQGN